MILTILLAIIISILLVYLFSLYLVWSLAQYSNDSSLGSSGSTLLLPPRSVADSYKYVNFWLQYYLAKNNITL